VRAVNLIPKDQLPGGGPAAGRSQGAVYGVLVLLGGLALLVFLYGKAHRQVSSRTAEVAALNAKVQQAQASVSGLAPYTSFVALREEREHAVAALIDQRFDWAHVYHELGRVLPRGGASISSIDGTVGSSTAGGAAAPGAGASSTGGKISSSGPAATAGGGATPAGSVPTINLSGCATSQSEVAVILNRLRLIDGVNEVTLQSSTKGNSGGASGASGSCPAGSPAFAVVLTFDPLPSGGAAAMASAAKTGGAR
jgi:Tfp pilus assembly protein PilN